MMRTEMQDRTRLSAPSVVSVIFAPRSDNYTLLSVSTRQRVSEAIALECCVQPDERVRRRVFENLRRIVSSEPQVVADYLREYLNTSYTTAILTLPTEIAIGQLDAVPARTFPFSTHLNLLSSPEEGLFFDPDDFAER